jgi:hypothetical protein
VLPIPRVRMVRRGSTVRVRQRASRDALPPQWAHSSSISYTSVHAHGRRVESVQLSKTVMYGRACKS